MTNSNSLQCDLLVIGGGIAGITAAVEASEMGRTVTIVEKEHYLGGKVVQMHRYFPKLCPPQCGLEINLRRLRNNPLVNILTGARINTCGGVEGSFSVDVTLEPRYVTEACTACGDCEKVCTVEVPNPFDHNLTKTKAIHLPHELAYPYRYLVDESAVNSPGMDAVAKSCPVNAIDLKMQSKSVTIIVKTIIYATGWQAYDAKRLTSLRFGEQPNVITNLMFERIASRAVLSDQKIVRPSDGKPLTSVAFVQCAGSRDDDHLPYCSAVCCMASLKQSRYIREQFPDAEIHIFFIDARTPGRWEDFLANVQDDPKTIIHRGKVGMIEPASDGNITLIAENTVTGELERTTVGLAILAVGMQPTSTAKDLRLPAVIDRYGFTHSNGATAFLTAGVASGPKDVAASVQEATGMVVRILSRTGRSN